MISVSLIDFIEDTGRYMLIAEYEPVIIDDNKGSQWVLCSVKHYNNLVEGVGDYAQEEDY